jgi:hypothetical protein
VLSQNEKSQPFATAGSFGAERGESTRPSSQAIDLIPIASVTDVKS